MLKTERLLETVFFLLSKKKATAEELAARFGVSKRTVLRDMESLALAGIPLFARHGKDGGFSLVESFVLDKSLLTEDEQKEILSALETIKPLAGTDTEKLLVKLKGIFSPRDARTDWLEVDFSRWGKQAQDTEKFNLLKSAILNRSPVAFTYSNTSGQTGNRRAYPLKLVFKKNAWYLQGFCPDKKDYRTFKLTRLREASVLPGRFEDAYLPPLLDKAEAPPASPASCRDRIPPEYILSLCLRFSPEAAYRVHDEFEPEEIKRNGDGSFTVKVSYPETDWVYGYLLSFGSSVTVISPRKVSEEIKKRAEEIRKKYL